MAETKGLWHGAFTQMPQPVTVKVIDEEKESAKKKGSFYVTLEIAGQTRYYNTENEACGRAFDGLKGQTVAVMVEGSREDARITVVGAPGSVPPPRRQAPAAAAPRTARTAPPATEPPEDHAALAESGLAPRTAQPAAATPEQAVKDAEHFVGRNRSLSIIALRAMMATCHEFEASYGLQMPDSLMVAVYTSMLYGAGARGVERHLPVVGVKFPAKQQ